MEKGEIMKSVFLRIISLTAAVFMVLSLFSCGKKENGDEELPSYCAKTESITLTVPMFTYFFNSYVKNYISLNADMIKEQGLDPEKSLESQKYSESMTWKDYFAGQVTPMISRMMSMATAAAAEKTSLSDEDIENIEKALEVHRTAAEEEKISADEYTARLYGEGVDMAVLEQCLKIRAMSDTYQQNIKVPDFSNMTDEESEKLFHDNPNGMLHYDCIKITVSSNDTEKLLKATDVESFTAAMREVVTKTNFGGKYEENSGLIENMLLSKTFIKERRMAGTDISDCAFEEGRKQYDICTVEQISGDITVVMILPAEGEPGKYNDVLYRDERPTYTVKTVSYDSVAAATMDYETIIETGDAASFFGGNGGGKEVVTREDISRSEVKGALREWIFTDGRELGDVGCVTVSESETVLVLVEGIGDASWKSEAKKVAAEEFRKNADREIMTKYPCEFNEDGIKAVKSVVLAEAEI